MDRVALFIVGASGAGKTALVRALLGYPGVTVERERWTHSLNRPLTAAGIYRGATLDGADALPPAPQLLAAMVGDVARMDPARDILFDGVRFGAVSARALVGVRVRTVLLSASIETLTGRRARRGSPTTSRSWYVASIDRAARQAAAIGDVMRLDTATATPREILQAVRGLLR